MLTRLYNKSRLGFAILWIVLYCVLMSVGDNLSTMIGIEKVVTLPIALLLSAMLVSFLKTSSFSTPTDCVVLLSPRGQCCIIFPLPQC